MYKLSGCELNAKYIPYSRHGHDEQKARLGGQICASVRKS